ncbi:hypothetical protein ATO10_01765 [Actibacterium atlanticum]|uniref:Uncharacterized protein n=1 Tax=Actibacterium atlanticum TaxID=1461693 RepID=A0A058ZQJ6_9RHOB|nr:hypothetical protein [Actibacterium atlanticum]KCV83447.1 hypothetical protein ATO10_01765 [Actibacterium atlanticum]
MNDVQDFDPKGLIREAYRIEGINLPDCRTIFLDWALSVRGETFTHVQALLDLYGVDAPDHPMTQVLNAALEGPASPQRRGGRAARKPQA